MATSWACKCLNVQISSKNIPAGSTRPPKSNDPKLSWVYVGEQGVNVVHSHVTLRTRERREVSGSGSQPTVYTVLACLICRNSVYRVITTLEKGEDFVDGPILDPNSDPSTPLVGHDGWVEVFVSNCLDTSAVSETKRSSRWSPHFGVLLPNFTEPTTNSAAPSGPSLAFPQLPEPYPLFLPHPFTPSDSTFSHLSSHAQAVSNASRAQAQNEINEYARQKLNHLGELDHVLRRQVDLIWSNWRAEWQTRTKGVKTLSERPKPASSSSRIVDPAVSIRNFEPPPHPSPSTSRRSTTRWDVRPPSVSRDSGSSSSLLTDARGRIASGTFAESSRSRSPEHPTNGTVHSIRAVSSPIPLPRAASLSESSSPNSRLLPRYSVDESKAIAASFQIRMSDTMRESRAAHLARLGNPDVQSEEEPIVEPPHSPVTPTTPSTKNEKKKVQFQTTEAPSAVRSPRPPIVHQEEEVLFDLDLGTYDAERSRREPEETVDEVDEDETFARRPRPGSEEQNNVSRSGFVGSMPADEFLKKLVTVETPTLRSSSNGAMDWKKAAREKARAEQLARARDGNSDTGSRDEDSPGGDEVMALPQIRRWTHKPVDIAASLPVSIGVFMPRGANTSGFSLEPKTSLVERQGVLVPPLPRKVTPTNPSGVASATRARSKSVSSVARDRTYAVRDMQRSKDPGEALTVPDEDDEEEEEEVVAGNGNGHGGGDVAERARLNAYRILQRQTDVPDETMWRSLAG